MKAQGVDVDIRFPTKIGGHTIGTLGGKIDQRTGELTDATVPADADVVVFQRPTAKLLAQAVPLLRSRGVAVVVDVDDDLTCIHPANPAWAALHPRREADNWQWLTQACRDATMVTASTPQLLERYAGHGRGRLLRNCVPLFATEIPRPEGPVVFGWPGSRHSHPDDLQVVGNAVLRLVGEGHRYRAVGPPDGIAEAFGLDDAQVTSTGSLTPGRWHEALCGLGVGFAPLADTRFNGAKSALKILELSAAGVCWVASPTPEYTLFAQLFGQPTAAKPRDWYRELRRFLTDDVLRTERSAALRELARGFSYEVHAHLWGEAWAEALEWQRRPSAPKRLTVV